MRGFPFGWAAVIGMIEIEAGATVPVPAATFHCEGTAGRGYTSYEVDGWVRSQRDLANVTVTQTLSGSVARSSPRPTVDPSYLGGAYVGSGLSPWDLGTSAWLNGTHFWLMFPTRFAASPNLNAELDLVLASGGGLQIPLLCTVTRVP
ncbi:MAG: hypothetical protein RLZZ383_1673 [Pseudomonadota bacterium]|jgi:hypothetical protein